MENFLLIPTKKKGIVCREEKDGFLIYNPNTDLVHLISPLGRELFELCNGKNTLLDLERICYERKLFSERGAMSLIMEFIMDLNKRSLIEYNDVYS